MSEPTMRSRLLRLKVWGENACFTRPEMKAERVSYDVMTPSAARGILEAVLWNPAIVWRVSQIDVLKPIRWESVRRNEVGDLMSPRIPQLFIEEQRQQRAGLFLREVAYTIHARLELTDKARPTDTTVKFQEMFLRRAKRGQCFHSPYLGCREFAAHFEPVVHGQPLPEPIRETCELGYMLHDIDYSNETPMPHFFPATLRDGRLQIPSFASGEVRT